VAQGRSQPSLEKIVALKPDLVVGLTGVHDPVFNKMRSLQVNQIDTEVTSFATLESHIKELAQAIDVDANPILQRYQTCFQNKPANAPTALVLISSKPILSANEQGWTGDLLKQLGFKNLAAELQGDNPRPGYLSLSPEKVLQANPEVILLVDFGKGLEDYKSLSFWNQLQASRSNRIYALSYFGFVNPSGVDAIAKTCEQLKQIAIGKAETVSTKP
jgi:iron complex transport system substrate-binding protein